MVNTLGQTISESLLAWRLYENLSIRVGRARMWKDKVIDKPCNDVTLLNSPEIACAPHPAVQEESTEVPTLFFLFFGESRLICNSRT